jgi:hypothetical protein
MAAKAKIELVPVKRIPLHESLMQLASILEYAENNEGVIPDDLLPALRGTEEAIVESVDRRYGLLKTCENAIQQLCEMQDSLSERKGRLEKIVESVRERTYQEMTFAETPKISGTYARFSIEKGGQRSVKWTVGLQKLTDIIDPVDLCRIDPAYITKMTVFHFDTKRYAKDMRDGRLMTIFDEDNLWDVTPNYPPIEMTDDQAFATDVARLMPKSTHLKMRNV